MSCTRTQLSDAGDSSCKQFRSRSGPTEIFSFILKLSRSNGSNDEKNGKVLKYDGRFFMEFNQTLIKLTTCQPKQK